MSESYLIDNYSLDLFSFTKPKKCNNLMVCKIKNDSKDILIQFPKMNVFSEELKGVELEFKNEKGYNKKVFDFLSKLDELVIDYITTHSEEWFEKKMKPNHVKKIHLIKKQVYLIKKMK